MEGACTRPSVPPHATARRRHRWAHGTSRSWEPMSCESEHLLALGSTNRAPEPACAGAEGVSPPRHLRESVAGERAGRLGFEVEIRLFAHIDPDAEDRAALERARRLVLLADVVAAVASDAEAVAGERELAHLCAHRPFSDDLVVHVELRLPDRLVVLAGRFPGELHAQHVLAWLEFARGELLLGLDAEAVVEVVQLLVLEEQRVAAETRAVRED